MHSFDHPIPFVGLVQPQSDVVDFDFLYNLIGVQDRRHPGHPEPQSEDSTSIPEFDATAIASYEARLSDEVEDNDILHVTKKLAAAWPPNRTKQVRRLGEPSKARRETVQQVRDREVIMGHHHERNYCVGMICRALLGSSDEV
jgi:hypothetical protein